MLVNHRLYTWYKDTTQYDTFKQVIVKFPPNRPKTKHIIHFLNHRLHFTPNSNLQRHKKIFDDSSYVDLDWQVMQLYHIYNHSFCD